MNSKRIEIENRDRNRNRTPIESKFFSIFLNVVLTIQIVGVSHWVWCFSSRNFSTSSKCQKSWIGKEL